MVAMGLLGSTMSLSALEPTRYGSIKGIRGRLNPAFVTLLYGLYKVQAHKVKMALHF